MESRRERELNFAAEDLAVAAEEEGITSFTHPVFQKGFKLTKM